MNFHSLKQTTARLVCRISLPLSVCCIRLCSFKGNLEWLSKDIFGTIVQIKKGVTIDRDKTSINLNENMDSLVPASKISDMSIAKIAGQTARYFLKTKIGRNGSIDIMGNCRVPDDQLLLKDKLQHG